MIDAVCDICLKQTCDPYVLELKKYEPYDKGYSDKIILCKDCADIMKKEIELLKVTRTTKPASYAEISYREYQAPHEKDI